MTTMKLAQFYEFQLFTSIEFAHKTLEIVHLFSHPPALAMIRLLVSALPSPPSPSQFLRELVLDLLPSPFS